MIRKGVLPILLILAVAVVSSCDDDSDGYATGPPPASKYKDLSERDHVLINLGFSYNERNRDRLDVLLDVDFIFHFSAADFRNGRVTVEDWDKAAEIGSARNIFDPNYEGPREPVSNIDLSLTYVAGDDRWMQVTPEDQEKYPGETWYEKTVRYSLTVQSGDISFVGDNLQASFLVRWVDVDGRNIWRIIEWRDDTESSLDQRSAGASDSGAVTQDKTWGSIKSLYAP